MKANKVKRSIVVFCIVLMVLLLVSCRDGARIIIGNGIEPVMLSTEYNLDDGIVISIYIGIGNETSKFPSNYKYQIAITNNIEEPFGYGEDLFILLEITSDPNGKYNYRIDKKGKVIYTYLEEFMLPSEIFSDASGFFYLGLLEISIGNDQSETVAGMMRYKFSYEVVDGKVTMLTMQ